MLKMLEILYALELKVEDRRHPSLQDKITGVSIDTRTIQPGNIFIALNGEKQNGHMYIKQAIEKGASLILLSDPNFCDDCGHHSYFIVPDTQKALEKLAMANRMKYSDSAKVVAITGSVGKTTLKEFLRPLLTPFGKTVASPKSFNNHLGVPISLNDLDDDTQFGVFEIGMNHIGEIAPLSCMVSPQIAVVTAIGPAHIGNMGSVDAIAQEKADIFRGLEKNGVAIIPADTPYLDILKNEADFRFAEIITVGNHPDAHVRLISCTFNDSGLDITANIFGEDYSWHMNAFGEHYALLSLFAIAVAIKLGIQFEDIKPYLDALMPLPGRGKIQVVPLKKGGSVTVIDDSYNANLASMTAGLSVLEKIKGKRKIAVLGELGELDHFSKEIHVNIAQLINSMNLDYVFTSGDEMIYTFDAIVDKTKALHGHSISEITPKIVDLLKDDDIIFLKGSNSNKLWTLIDAL